MNYVILCDTTYQVLSAISFRMGNTNHTDRVDLLVDTLRTTNVDMRALASRIEKAKIFSNVYCIENYQSKWKKNKRIGKALEWLFPRLIYKRITKGINEFREYDVVVVSGPFSTQRCLISALPHSKIYFIEDGLGSYIGRNGINELSWRGRIAQKVLRNGPSHIYPNHLFLYYPAFYEGEYKSRVKQMTFPKEHMDVLCNIFSIDGKRIKSVYKDYRFVYFSQLLGPETEEMQYEKELVQSFKNKYKDELIVRPHPRGILSIYDGLNIDDTFSQWELCCTDIDERTVLIGSFSTALFVPKLIYGNEPTVVFTYKIYGNSYVDEAVKRLKSIYTHKNRVICISTVDELTLTLENLKKGTM